LDPSKRIALFTVHDASPWLRQTPKGSGDWGRWRYSFNSGADDAHWLVVYDELRASVRTTVPKARRIIVISEPSDFKIYSPRYLNQFGVMLSPMPTPGFTGIQIQTDVGLPWSFGLDMLSSQRPFPCRYDFDALAALARGEKTHALSAVVSMKTQLRKHRVRVEFTEALGGRLGDRLIRYGQGLKPIGDKADAILPYTHHLVVENNDEDNFFTEKLTDAYLGWSMPIFSGCQNIEGFFPAEALRRFDIYATDAVDRVVAALDAPVTPSQWAAIGQARVAVLERYNIFARLSDIIAGLAPIDAAPVDEILHESVHFAPLGKRLRTAWKRVRPPRRKPLAAVAPPAA